MRLPVPRVLKRLLLPIWNGGHLLAFRIGEHLEALAAGRIELCAVCGRRAAMLLRRRVIPERLVELWGLSPRLAEALRRKESLDCSRCGAKLRARRLAEVLLELYPTAKTVDSIAAWVETPEARGLRIAEINRVDGLHEQWSRLPLLSFSDYFPGTAPGEIVDGVRHEDLCATTYADAAFDLLVTSETLEHVPRLDRAMAEIRRILKPGGLHVFTIPLLPHVESTYARATLDEAGNLVRHAPAIAHPGGDVGYPVFTEFGLDFPGILERAGFDVEVRFGPTTEDDLAQVFVTTWRDDDAIQPGGPSSSIT